MIYRHRTAVLYSLCLLLLAACLPGSSAGAQTGERCFPETGVCISGPIRAFWERNGGLAAFGFPVAPQQAQQIEGRTVQAQWFERNRLELHPENAAPYDVQLGRLGADRLAQTGRDWFAFPKGSQHNGCRFFAETGHSVCGDFLARWQAGGIELDGRRGTSTAENLALWGLPLSEPQQETLGDGKQYTVQWFERARLELHPENQPPYNVLLGLLGNEVLGNTAQPAPQPTSTPNQPQTSSAELRWEADAHQFALPEQALFPSVALDGNNIAHLVFQTKTGVLWYVNDIGGGFGHLQSLDNDIGLNSAPLAQLAVGADNTLHLVYVRAASDQQVVYRQARLTADGVATWGAPQIVSEGARSFGAALAIDGQGNAHITWIDKRCGQYGTFYRVRRADGSLGPSEQPSPDCRFQDRPKIVLTADGRPHLIYQHDTDIFYARRDSSGWAVRNVSESSRTKSLTPAIATDGRNIYTAWDEGSNNHDILFRFSYDGGNSWSSITPFSNTPEFASMPAAAYGAPDRRVYVIWIDASKTRSKEPNIWQRAYDVAADQFTSSGELGVVDGAAREPSIFAGQQRVIAVWQEKRREEWQLHWKIGTYVPKG